MLQWYAWYLIFAFIIAFSSFFIIPFNDSALTSTPCPEVSFGATPSWIPRANPVDAKTPADTNCVVPDAEPRKPNGNASSAGKDASGLLDVFVETNGLCGLLNGLFGTADTFADSPIEGVIRARKIPTR